MRRLFILCFVRCEGMPVIVLRISSKGSLTETSSGASPLLHAAGRRQDMNNGYRQAIHCEKTGVQMAITRSGSSATFLNLYGSRFRRKRQYNLYPVQADQVPAAGRIGDLALNTHTGNQYSRCNNPESLFGNWLISGQRHQDGELHSRR